MFFVKIKFNPWFESLLKYWNNVSTKSGDCVLEILDTADSEKYRSLAPMYYEKSHAMVIAVNASIEGQFESLQNWFESSNDKKDSDDTLIDQINQNNIMYT